MSTIDKEVNDSRTEADRLSCPYCGTRYDYEGLAEDIGWQYPLAPETADGEVVAPSLTVWTSCQDCERGFQLTISLMKVDGELMNKIVEIVEYPI